MLTKVAIVGAVVGTGGLSAYFAHEYKQHSTANTATTSDGFIQTPSTTPSTTPSSGSSDAQQQQQYEQQLQQQQQQYEQQLQQQQQQRQQYQPPRSGGS